MKMIEYVYHRVKEDVARKEMKMEQNQKKREQKMEQKQYEKKILEIRIKELNSKLEKKRRKRTSTSLAMERENNWRIQRSWTNKTYS